jgi:hypothetical protein
MRTPIFVFAALSLLLTSLAQAQLAGPQHHPQLFAIVPVEPHDWINVKTDFGAAGDGVTDDTAAFANAIAALETTDTAAYILVPPGTYQVDYIKVVADTHLKGSGKRRTIIRARTPGVGAGIMRREHAQAVTVEDLQLQGFRYGIDARSIYNSEFRNLYIQSCTTGIYLGRRNYDEGLSISDVFMDIRVVDSTAFTLDVDISAPGDLVNACQFHSCIFESNSNAPVRFRGNGGNGLVGNSFHGCSLQGTSLQLAQINGLGWFGGYGEGNYLIDAEASVCGLTVTGMYFQSGGGTAVVLGSVAGGTVRAVTFGACTFTGTSGGTAIQVRPDIGAASSGIFIQPNEYLGGLTPITDPAGKALVLKNDGTFGT